MAISSNPLSSSNHSLLLSHFASFCESLDISLGYRETFCLSGVFRHFFDRDFVFGRPLSLADINIFAVGQTRPTQSYSKREF
jgi:hypothetical protein